MIYLHTILLVIDKPTFPLKYIARIINPEYMETLIKLIIG